MKDAKVTPREVKIQDGPIEEIAGHRVEPVDLGPPPEIVEIQSEV